MQVCEDRGAGDTQPGSEDPIEVQIILKQKSVKFLLRLKYNNSNFTILLLKLTTFFFRRHLNLYLNTFYFIQHSLLLRSYNNNYDLKFT